MRAENPSDIEWFTMFHFIFRMVNWCDKQKRPQHFEIEKMNDFISKTFVAQSFPGSTDCINRKTWGRP